jgi:KUP system potassium uptake protein
MSSPEQAGLKRTTQLALGVGALGVVFGDIGTSPLYALRECISRLGPVDRTEGILGVMLRGVHQISQFRDQGG